MTDASFFAFGGFVLGFLIGHGLGILRGLS